MNSLLTLFARSRNGRRLSALVIAFILATGALPFAGAKAQIEPATVSAQSKLSPALLAAITDNRLLVWANPSRRTVRVLVQTTGAISNSLTTAISQAGGSVVRRFSSINGLLAELPKDRVIQIASRGDVERMTADHLAQQSASHLEAATAADAVRSYRSSTGTFNGLDGSGVGIAILDSGLMASHSDFHNSSRTTRVAASTDIVSGNQNLVQFLLSLGLISSILDIILGPSNKDAYGHGSHVAGVAAGRSIGSSSARGFQGIAPNAKLIDVRVLNDRGLGQMSDVIAGIDWVISNRSRHNIKVMNLSLGAGSTESWVTDPLCRAARRAVASGITVVAAAGNYGVSAEGLEQYGSITAPGNDPTVITVGAANTHQSDARGDESITYFSSRGPTRGHTVDQSGETRYDNLLKPDLAAPGNRIVSAESRDSHLREEYPQLHESGSGSSAFMKLSGTSVAAPAAAGAAALLLQKNPGLTPALVKAILQYTAEQLPDASIIKQGAGLLNIEGATRLAGALKTNISTSIKQGSIRVGDSMLATGATFPSPVSNIGGRLARWGRYIFAGGSHILAGEALFRRYQAIYDPAIVWVRDAVTRGGTPVANGSSDQHRGHRRQLDGGVAKHIRRGRGCCRSNLSGPGHRHQRRHRHQ